MLSTTEIYTVQSRTFSFSSGSTKPPAHPEDGDRVSPPVKLENLHILMRLSDGENFTEFCHCESFKTYNLNCDSTMTVPNRDIEKDDPKDFTYNVRSAIL
jgi:hypothetical protein